MDDIERLAAENARLKAILSKQGFKITYNSKTGSISRITPPRKPAQKHTVVTWANKRGYTGSMALARKITKNKAVSLRSFKNAVERAGLIREAKDFLSGEGYKLPDRYFEKIPTYVLKNNNFYEDLNRMYNYVNESEADELTNENIRQATDEVVRRIKLTRKRPKRKSRGRL